MRTKDERARAKARVHARKIVCRRHTKRKRVCVRVRMAICGAAANLLFLARAVRRRDVCEFRYRDEHLDVVAVGAALQDTHNFSGQLPGRMGQMG